MIRQRLTALGYQFEPAPLEVNPHGSTFHAATRVGNLIFTSGQIPLLNGTAIQGKVGSDIDLATAQKAAELCAYNCFRAAGAVVDIDQITRVVKLLGMVNVAEGFNQTSEVINGCTAFLNTIFGATSGHVRSAVGMVIPANWAVEIEMIFAIE